MKETYTAVMKKSGDWWVGWIEEVPGVNCQEATRVELLRSLRVTLREALCHGITRSTTFLLGRSAKISEPLL